MTIDHPTPEQLPQLRALWKQAFGDGDAFLDGFFSAGFSPNRCRCITDSGRIAAALYWFETEYRGLPLAYLYAIATDKDFRSRGLCRRLMEDTHALLTTLGFAGTILVPAEESLFSFYASMGYREFGTHREFTASASGPAAILHPISTEEYARLRRLYLPEDAVLQEGAALAFLQTYSVFYAGSGLLLAAVRDGSSLCVPELLGDPAQAPGILAALDAPEGTFRIPGQGKPFAMARSLTSTSLPSGYFGLALD